MRDYFWLVAAFGVALGCSLILLGDAQNRAAVADPAPDGPIFSYYSPNFSLEGKQ